MTSSRRQVDSAGDQALPSIIMLLSQQYPATTALTGAKHDESCQNTDAPFARLRPQACVKPLSVNTR